MKRAAAAWLYKTALLIPLAQTSRDTWPTAVGQRCSDLYRQRRPPTGARVWIGRYDLQSSFPDLVTRADVSEVAVTRRGLKFSGTHVLITIGYLLSAVVFWPADSPDLLPQETERFPESSFRRIWPVEVEHSMWPPDHTFKYQELEGLSTWGVRPGS